MPVFTDVDKSKLRYYLGYLNDQIPHGDYAILERELNRERAQYEIDWLLTQMLQCYYAFMHKGLDQQDSGIDYRRIITGDTNRTDIQYRSESLRDRRRNFIRETDQLARMLGVINYHNPENDDRKYMGTIQP